VVLAFLRSTPLEANLKPELEHIILSCADICKAAASVDVAFSVLPLLRGCFGDDVESGVVLFFETRLGELGSDN
jgi:hypothetical protein